MKLVTRLAGLGVISLTLGLMTAPAAQASTTTTLKIFADVAPPGTATLSVIAGDSVTVTATGNATYGYQGAPPCGPGTPITTPDGAEYLNGIYCGTVTAGDDGVAPMSSQPVGMLVGRNAWDGGTSGWFVIAASRTWTIGHNGTLHLAYNDSVYGDNTGYYTVTVTDNGQ